MRPFPEPFREAIKFAVKLPVIWMSPGEVASLLVMEVILVKGAASQLSDTVAETVTATSLLFAWERTLGLTVRLWIAGAVLSLIVSGTFWVALFPAASSTV